MSDNANIEKKVKGRGGRKPMTPEEKAAAAETRAAEKAKADSMKPEVVLQYQGDDIAMDALIEAAKSDFRTNKKRTLITGLKMYVKPEDHMAYYVINDKFEGKISF